MYPCKYNKCNVVFKYQRVLHEEPFPYDCDEDKNIILSAVVLVEEIMQEYKDFLGADPEKRYFHNRFTGYIDDPKQLVPADVGDLGKSFEVWIKHVPNEFNPAKFAVVKLGVKMRRKLAAAQKKLENI
uniref:Uncharacterized protein n=1 Tax=Ditylenchus dipsaci TaxID=166011 RepID=A0A915EGW0_9BILA